MDPIQDYANAINTPLTSGSTSPMTIVTPKLAIKAYNQVKSGVNAINQAQAFHRANMGQLDQVKKQEDYQIQQDNYQKQQDQIKLQQEQQQQQQSNKLDELSLLLKNNG